MTKLEKPYRPYITDDAVLGSLTELMQLEGSTEATAIVTRVLRWALPVEIQSRRQFTSQIFPSASPAPLPAPIAIPVPSPQPTPDSDYPVVATSSNRHAAAMQALNDLSDADFV